MPNKDGTGPKGNGPKTGKGLGSCEGSKVGNWLTRRWRNRNGY